MEMTFQFNSLIRLDKMCVGRPVKSITITYRLMCIVCTVCTVYNTVYTL